ncbi:MAG: hypothetical protein R3A13_11640 [Bdellovibrionota bacterium]
MVDICCTPITGETFRWFPDKDQQVILAAARKEAQQPSGEDGMFSLEATRHEINTNSGSYLGFCITQSFLAALILKEARTLREQP